jgi:phospholipase/lecithinase/hemolysin
VVNAGIARRVRPLQSLVSELAAQRGPTTVAADGVHPTPLGHRLVADARLAAYGNSLSTSDKYG